MLSHAGEFGVGLCGVDVGACSDILGLLVSVVVERRGGGRRESTWVR